MKNVKNIEDCKQMMDNGLSAPLYSIDYCLNSLEELLNKYSNSKVGRSGDSNKNEMMSRPTLMYLWYLIKQGKIVKVEHKDKSAEAVNGHFLLVPMYDDEGKPTLEAIIPIVAKGEGYELGEYQKILFVDKMLDFEILDGWFIQESYRGGSRIRKCRDRLEYLENINSITTLDKVCSITDSKGRNYLADPLLASHTIITITGADGKPELYQIVGNPHSFDDLNDPSAKKASDGYITQDIIIPMILGIGADSKRIKRKGDKEVAYRYSSPIAKFMALASLFVSHELHKGKLEANPDNDFYKRKARVKEWDMIEGFNKSIVEPFEKLFPNEDPLKILTLAIDTFILTILCSDTMDRFLKIAGRTNGKESDEAMEKFNKTFNDLIRPYTELFGNKAESILFENINVPENVLTVTNTWKWLSYFLSMKTAWESTPYVNHKDLRRSHNTMYNLEFTEENFNDAHGALVGAFASLPNATDYVKTVTVPSKKKVNGENVYTTKQMQVFKNHYGISAYILYDYDKYMFNIGATGNRGQFIKQLRDIAVKNRMQANSPMPKYFVIAPDEVDKFKKFLEEVYGYGTDNYWKLV